MKKYFSILLIAFYNSDAHALGALSRACQFSTIPSAFKIPAGEFFAAIGGDPYARVLPNRPEAEQANYWVMESLTTDYLRARYYLYSIASYFTKNPYRESNNYNKWQVSGSASSPIWNAETVSEALKADPRFSPYYANRQTLFSSRAGSSKIIENLGSFPPVRATTGMHYYYDPVTKVTSRLPDTTAFDCNLGNWGFGNGIFDR